MPLYRRLEECTVTKSELKNYMIVETGFDNCKYIVLNGRLVDDELRGFSIDDFDENLINKKNKPYSISKVYEEVNIPFELNTEEIVKKYNPKVIWERQPTRLSKKMLSGMKPAVLQKYLRTSVVYPCIIVE